jgi:hypoxanthine phosphoribosyltransferase
MEQAVKNAPVRTLISAEQIQKRIREMARQISDDYKGKTIHVLALLENGFIFVSDLVRVLDVPVTCQFIKPKYTYEGAKPEGALEIFFSHDADIRGKHVLLVEGVVHSGVTTEFLVGDLKGRGAESIKVATLLDRQTARRVQFQPDYFGFLVDEAYVFGYGLGSPEQTQRNLPFLAVSSDGRA